MSHLRFQTALSANSGMCCSQMISETDEATQHFVPRTARCRSFLLPDVHQNRFSGLHVSALLIRFWYFLQRQSRTSHLLMAGLYSAGFFNNDSDSISVVYPKIPDPFGKPALLRKTTSHASANLIREASDVFHDSKILSRKIFSLELKITFDFSQAKSF